MDLFYPVEIFSDFLSYSLLGLQEGSYLGEALNFFIYDAIKIGILLILINFLMAITRYYFPLGKVRQILAGHRWYGLDYILAAILGVVTPFCSCSSIPLFIGFLSAGIPLGVTFAFLIASPLVNESSLIIFPALFGTQVTLVYNLVGILVAVIGGLVIQSLRLEKYVNQDLLKLKISNRAESKSGSTRLSSLVYFWWQDGISITRSVFPYVILGVALGAAIHGFVPSTLIENSLAVQSWWSVPLAVLLGIPLYANSVSVVPVAQALIGKGIPLGTALAFMTATVTLSIPEALILKKVMRWPLLAAFFGTTTLGIIFIGYLFNYLY